MIIIQTSINKESNWTNATMKQLQIMKCICMYACICPSYMK